MVDIFEQEDKNLAEVVLRQIDKLVKSCANMAEFATLCGLKDSRVRGWVTNRRLPPVDGLLAIAKRFDLSLDYFVKPDFGEGEMFLGENQNLLYNGTRSVPGFAHVRKIKTKLSAGPGAFVYEEEDDGRGYYFREDWLRRWCNPEDALMFDVDGSSSEPLIRGVDSVLMNKAGREIIEGEFYAIRHGDVLKLKQLSWQLDGRIEVKSHNQEAEERSVLARPEEIEILGHVFWRAGLVGRAARR